MTFPPFDILEEEGKGHEKNYADYIFYPFDMSIEIHKRMYWSHHAAGDQVLPRQLCHLPVDPGQATDHYRSNPETEETSCTDQ